MRYSVLHAFLTYRVYKRLYLSALNLVNFLKTPCTTAHPEGCALFFGVAGLPEPRAVGIRRSPFFFGTKGARCFVGFTGLPEPQELQIQRHSSSLAQMSPFVRTPADAIEKSYAAAGCFPIIGFFRQKRVASLFSCRRSFFNFLRPQHIPHIRPTQQLRRMTQKKRQPLSRRTAANIPRRRNSSSSQALFQRP